LQSGTQARADWRALMSAAFIGSAVGLVLGAGYLTAGLGQAALDHSAAVRLSLRPAVGFSRAAVSGVAAVNPQLAAAQPQMDPDAVRVAQVRPSRARELDCLTQAVYFEARGESARGQQAVATVIMNRVKNPNFPKTVCGVVYQGATHRNGCQFSFACDGQAERVVEHSAWDRARGVAARVLSGAVLREVGSATHFHATGVDPEWGSRMRRVAQVGLHVFYRFNPHAPRPVQTDADDDDGAVFASQTPAAAPLRLAEAVALPVPAPAAKAASASPPAVVRLPDTPPLNLNKTDAPAAPKTQATAPS
jgi:spore germination cell wall hydrolase CwlJ-like protein